MTLKWLGQSCFVLDTGMNKIVFDPYEPMAGYGELKLTANRVFVSHQHPDHNNVNCVTLEKWDDNDKICTIEEIKSFHDDKNGAERGENTIYIIGYDKNRIRVVHLGDLGHMLEDEALDVVTGCDVMLIPVGGFFTIDSITAVQLVKTAKPRIVIPMHYHFDQYGPPMISGVEPFLEAIKSDYPVFRVENNLIECSEELPRGVYVLTYQP